MKGICEDREKRLFRFRALLRSRHPVMSKPQYPEIHVRTESDNPFALVAAVRLALRQAHIEHPEIERFTREALSDDDLRSSRRVCRSWVRVDH